MVQMWREERHTLERLQKRLDRRILHPRELEKGWGASYDPPAADSDTEAGRRTLPNFEDPHSIRNVYGS